MDHFLPLPFTQHPTDVIINTNTTNGSITYSANHIETAYAVLNEFILMDKIPKKRSGF